MNAIRVQIHLKYFFEENSSKNFYNFCYAFQPTKISTITDLIEDIRVNYLQPQLSAILGKIDDNDNLSFIIQLDDCQLLPFTSSQILRDNDQLILTPLNKYKVHRKALQDTIQLNSSTTINSENPPSVLTSPKPPVVVEKPSKPQQVEPMEHSIVTESSITIVRNSTQIEEPPRKKKTTEQPMVISPIEKTKVQQPQAEIVKQAENSEAPVSVPSNGGRLRELRSKTPTWKTEKAPNKGNPQEKLHIRFDSDSEEEPAALEEQPTFAPPPPLVEANGRDQSIDIPIEPSPPAVIEPVKKSENGKQNSKKTIDLLLEMKQIKRPEELLGKKIQKQYGRKRAQHRKRAMAAMSLGSFVDQAFGLNREDREKQFSSTDYHSSSSSNTPQTLPTSFNKLARLPLIAEAVESNEKIYDLYPPVNEYPAIETRIAFKLLELSEDFCPTMSDFKEGTVMEINRATGEVTIQLDQPLQTAFTQPSKFYAPNEDEFEQELTTMVVPFSELQSVRLLSTSNGNGTE